MDEAFISTGPKVRQKVLADPTLSTKKTRIRKEGKMEGGRKEGQKAGREEVRTKAKNK